MPVFSRGDLHLLFVHVPKAGGSSMESIFASAGFDITFLRREALNVRSNINHIRRCSPQHMHAELLDATFRLRAFDGIFMVTRDPIDRFRSEYAFNARKSFDGSGAAVEAWAETKFRAYRENPFIADNHFRPQAEFYVPGSDVFRLEDGLDVITSTLSTWYGIDLPETLHENSSTRPSVGSSSAAVEISPRLEARLRHFYAADFTQFGY